MRSVPVYIVINGILSRPGDSHAWTDRAVTWLHNDETVEVQAEKFEYAAGAITRRLWAEGWAMALAGYIRRYTGRPIHLVGHSNGCDLILRALKQTSTEIRSIHMIAGACDEDCDRNGLNEMLWRGQVGSLHAYISPDDCVLKYLGRPTRWLFGWAGLGYGQMGRVGPENDEAFAGKRIFVHEQPGFGHSTWFAGKHFAETFSAILKNDHHESL